MPARHSDAESALPGAALLRDYLAEFGASGAHAQVGAGVERYPFSPRDAIGTAHAADEDDRSEMHAQALERFAFEAGCRDGASIILSEDARGNADVMSRATRYLYMARPPLGAPDLSRRALEAYARAVRGELATQYVEHAHPAARAADAQRMRLVARSGDPCIAEDYRRDAWDSLMRSDVFNFCAHSVDLARFHGATNACYRVGDEALARTAGRIAGEFVDMSEDCVLEAARTQCRRQEGRGWQSIARQGVPLQAVAGAIMKGRLDSRPRMASNALRGGERRRSSVPAP